MVDTETETNNMYILFVQPNQNRLSWPLSCPLQSTHPIARRGYIPRPPPPWLRLHWIPGSMMVLVLGSSWVPAAGTPSRLLLPCSTPTAPGWPWWTIVTVAHRIHQHHSAVLWSISDNVLEYFPSVRIPIDGCCS
ncbi:hypothetical protein VTO42DRAFT_2079 [Malbranchea cinnamomea]